MAASVLILNNPLCFVRNKFNKTPLRLVKNALVDFYTIVDISAAKLQLLDDIEPLKNSVKFPHVPQRRDADMGNRLVREVDDILALFTCLDEHKSMEHLPMYVADGPDNMPVTRLYEGDLGAMMTLIEKINEKMEGFGSNLAAVTRDLNEIRAKQTVPVLSVVPEPTLQQTVGVSRAPDTNSGLGARSKVSSHDSVTMTSRDPRPARGSLSLEQVQGMNSWAAAAASTPVLDKNRYAVLASTDDDDNAPLTVVESKRSAKRRRMHSQQQHDRQQAEPQPQRRARGRLLMTGKSDSKSPKFAAAQPIVKKAVFCVDNVDLAMDVNCLTDFVSRQLKVRVLTCFQTNPRRRRNDPQQITDRKAFRLCINNEDCDKFLDESKWPRSIVISAWYFKGPADAVTTAPQGSTEHSMTRTIAHQNAEPTTAEVSVSVSSPIPCDNEDDQEQQSDSTLIYQSGCVRDNLDLSIFVDHGACG